jgi:hypothetical protein
MRSPQLGFGTKRPTWARRVGSLFSSELVFGYPIVRYFAPTNDLLFDYGMLWPLRAASRRVLTRLFGMLAIRLRHEIANPRGCSLGCSSLPSDPVHPSTRVRSDLRRERS